MKSDVKKYRYPGVSPFSKDQSEIFFGRDKDVDFLRTLVELQDLVVLFSKSGLGKSSLVNAGIVPQIIEKGEFNPILIRFGSYIENKDEMRRC